MDTMSTMSNETTDSTKVEAAGEHNGTAPEETRRSLEEEFNAQRAKMKELFLQKEGDSPKNAMLVLRYTRQSLKYLTRSLPMRPVLTDSELVLWAKPNLHQEGMRKMIQDKEQLESEVMSLRAELQQLQTLSENQKSEIQSLQLLVNETVEASSSGTEELRRLRARNLELEQHLNQMRQQQQEVSLAPATFVRSLARKLGAEAEEQPPPRKQNVEDSELMRSIIQPLDMEILALKNKLRETDAQLQNALALQKTKASVAAPSGDSRAEGEAPRPCDMCLNYEKQLVTEQAQAEAARDRVSTLELALKQATEELEGVRSLHDETVRSWHSERALSSSELQQLQRAVRELDEALQQRALTAQHAEQRALLAVTELTVERETLHKKLESLERDNAMLIGQYTKKAAEMQNEIIDLPDNVEELQEHILRIREQLIFCQIGREEAVETERELRTQLLEQGALFHQQEAVISDLKQRLNVATEDLDRVETERSQMRELGDKLRQSTETLEQLAEDKRRLLGDVGELRAKLSALQHELDNSEKVQQDFVRLSQSLQVQLQRIREADTEVRWQHDDDVHECPSCHTPLPNIKKKHHCRHCGRIFCSTCVAHVVLSGPRRQPARVCGVCATLLQPHRAPYFSTAPPRSPD